MKIQFPVPFATVLLLAIAGMALFWLSEQDDQVNKEGTAQLQVQPTSPAVTTNMSDLRVIVAGFTVPGAAPSLACSLRADQHFCFYTVQAGDTFSDVAAKYGLRGNAHVTAGELIAHSNWPRIGSTDEFLSIGTILRVPAGTGVIYSACRHETAQSIAKMYGVEAQSIVSVPGNPFDSEGRLAGGDYAFIPSPEKLPERKVDSSCF
jgi:hypothetical protein